MSWIKTIAYKEAELPLKKLYDQVSGPDGSIDNVLKIHGLRPHTLRGHLGLYKSVLHHKNNMLPLWYLEAIGVFVSHLNHCNYCVDHHLTRIQRLKSVESAERLMRAIIEECLKDYFSPKEISGLEYSRTLTLEIQQLSEKDVQQMKSAGYDDGEILEINQVVSYFNYVNRTVLGLGVSTKGDILGLSPKQNSNIDDWEHH